MLIYETPIKFFQYFIAALSCFYIIPIYFWTVHGNINDDKFLYTVGLFSFVLAVTQFLYMLKKFQVYDDRLVIKRPFFFRSFNRTFQKQEIEKVNFRLSTSKIGGGINLVVYQKKQITSFQVICTKQTLKELITSINKAEIEVNSDFKMAN